MSNKKKLKNIFDIIKSEENNNYDKNIKNKFSNSKENSKAILKKEEKQSPGLYSSKYSQNTKNENINENSNNNYIDDIRIYSDREIFPILGSNQDNNNLDNTNSIDNNIKNNNSNEFEGINLSHSFRPKIPNSPEFSKPTSEFKYYNNENKSNNKKHNNNYNKNNDFSETVKTKIQGDNTNKNNNSKKEKEKDKLIIIDYIIKDNGYNPLYEQNNIICPEEYNNKNKDNEDNNTSKDSEEIEKQKEEEFLRKINNQVIEEENGKENVIDEEDNQEINFNFNYKKANNFEQNKFSRNKDCQNLIISATESSIHKLSDTKVKEMPIKLLQDYIRDGQTIEANGKNISLNNNNNIDINNYINNNNINKYNYQNKDKKEEIKVGPSSGNKNIKNMIYKGPIIKKTGIKNNKLNSPYKKNVIINNVNNPNNSNYNSENKIPSSISSFNIQSNKNNLIKNKEVYSKKNLINQCDLNNIKKKLYEDSEIKPNKIEKKKPKIIKMKERTPVTPTKPRRRKTKEEKYSFTPLINKRSRAIWEKRNEKIEENSKSPEKNFNSNSNKKNKIPVYELLTEIGISQREKLKEKYMTENEKIKSEANIKKINNNAYDMAIKGMNNKIDKIISLLNIDENITIVEIVQILCLLRIINALIKSDQIKDLNLKDLKFAIDNRKNKNREDPKKLEELEFIEQLYFIINPTLEENINSKLFSDLIKILFASDNSKIKNSSDEIKNLLDEYEIDSKNNKEGIYITPLREEQTFEQKDIWSIPKLIKSFLKLKSDLIAYKNNFLEFKKEQLKNNLIEEKEKELIFHPEINKKNFIFKNSKYDYYNDKDNSDLSKTYSNATHTRKNDFNKLYERFMEEKKIHDMALERLRESKRQKEIKKCTLNPKIIEYKPRKLYSKNRLNKSVDITSSYKINDINKKVPRYERLYSLRKIYNYKKIKVNEDEELGNKYNSRGAFKEKKNKSKNKNMKQKIQKNEYHEYAIKKKDLIINNKNIDNINDNTNNKFNNNKVYERKIQKMRMKQFNISKETDKNIIDDIYVIMDINTPKGGKRPIKIYKNQENLSDLVDQFCKKNKINDIDKKVIYNQALLYKNNIFGRNTDETNFEDK